MERITTKYNISHGYFYQIARGERKNAFVWAEIQLEIQNEQRKLNELLKQLETPEKPL